MSKPSPDFPLMSLSTGTGSAPLPEMNQDPNLGMESKLTNKSGSKSSVPIPDTHVAAEPQSLVARITEQKPIEVGLDTAASVFGLASSIKPAPQSIASRKAEQQILGSEALLREELANIQKDKIILKNYRVIDLLGKGGMGEVWKLEHQQLGNIRALKVIRSRVTPTAEVRGRFLREAKIMDKLGKHPHAVALHEFDLQDDVGYILMEFVDGQDLRQIARAKKPMPLLWIGRVLGQLCDVLDSAHRLKIVHRDLKPSNLMLLTGMPPGEEYLKVLDFGIARDLSRPDDLILTQDSFVGTIGYASPEQIRQSTSSPNTKVDHRADIYSIGVLLYQFLSGRQPFTGTQGAVMLATLNNPPPPIADVRNDPDAEPLPLGLETLVQRCLAKVPEDRPQSAKELAEAFFQITKLEPPPGLFRGSIPTPWPFPRRDDVLNLANRVIDYGSTDTIFERDGDLTDFGTSASRIRTPLLSELPTPQPPPLINAKPPSRVNSFLDPNSNTEAFDAPNAPLDQKFRSTPVEPDLKQEPTLPDLSDSMVIGVVDFESANCQLANVEVPKPDDWEAFEGISADQSTTHKINDSRQSPTISRLNLILASCAIAMLILVIAVVSVQWIRRNQASVDLKLSSISGKSTDFDPGSSPTPVKKLGPPEFLIREHDGKRLLPIGKGVYLPEGYRPMTQYGYDSTGRWPKRLVRESDQVEWIWVEGGDFQMGEDPEPGQPNVQQLAVVTGFYFQRLEVTNGEWRRYLQESGRPVPPIWLQMVQEQEKQSKAYAESCAAVGVTRREAGEFAKHHGGSLPIEAQWEFAARSRVKVGRPYVWLNDHNKKSLIHVDLPLNHPLPADCLKCADITDQGIIHLAGNVREWCRDLDRPNFFRAPSLSDQLQWDNPVTLSIGSYVARGASIQDSWDRCRNAARSQLEGPDQAYYDVGFRIIIEGKAIDP